MARPGTSSPHVMATGLGRERSTVEELLDLIQRPAWMADALCREYPQAIFFPERGQSSEPARAVCARCLVRPECLAWALEHVAPGMNGGHGVWAGTTGLQRRQMHKGVALDARAAVQDRQRRLDDQRRAITLAWLEDPGQSGRAVSRAVGATLKLVLTVKRELEAAGDLVPASPAA